MFYSIEPRDRLYVKGYRFLSFSKIVIKYLSGKYSRKFLDSAKKCATDAIKTASKRGIQKTAEVTGNLINKIDGKITKASSQNASETSDIIPPKIYILSEKRQEIIDELRLI